MSTCAPHSYRNINGSEYIWGFEGVPFNLVVNSAIFVVSYVALKRSSIK